MLADSRIQVRDVDEILTTIRKPGADRLLIFFGWAAAPDLAKMTGIAPLFSHDCTSIIVRDPGRSWYNLAIDGLSKDADDLFDQLAERIGAFPRHKITACGFSMGGYAALLFGAKLGVGGIIAGAPQVVLHPKLPHAPKVTVKYDNITSVIAEAPKETKIDIWYGAESFSDLFNMAHVPPQENLTINAVSGSMHNVLQTFKRRGQMPAFLEHVAVDTPFSTKTILIPRAARSRVIKAGRLFYLHRKFDSVIDTLAPIADDIGLSAVHCIIADSYFRLGNYDGARSYYERAAAASHENYDANYNLGLSLEKLKKDRAAVRAFAKALEFVPSLDGYRYAKLASAQLRIGAVDEAIKNHTIAINTENYPAVCHYELGTILLGRRQEQEALEHFEKHRAAFPKFKPTLRRIAALTYRIAKRNVQAWSSPAHHMCSTWRQSHHLFRC